MAARIGPAGFCYLNDPVLGILGWLDQGCSGSCISTSTRITATACRMRSTTIPVCSPSASTRRDAGRAPGRRRIGPGGRRAISGAAGVQRQRDAASDAACGAAGDTPFRPAGDPAAVRCRRAGGGSAGEALSVQQRALGGGGGDPRPRPAAGGGGGRRLQPVYRGALLGGDLGHAQRYRGSRPDHACGRDSVACSGL